MVLVNCSFTKAIYKELSTNDSETDLTNKLENYIRILENSFNIINIYALLLIKIR